MCAYTCVCVCAHVCVHVCVCVRVRVCIRARAHSHLGVRVLLIGAVDVRGGERLARAEGVVLRGAGDVVAQLGAHEGRALAGLDVQELHHLARLAVHLDGHAVLVGAKAVGVRKCKRQRVQYELFIDMKGWRQYYHNYATCLYTMLSCTRTQLA